MPRVVAIADLHGNLPVDLPEGDVLVIAGDVCPVTNHEINFQERWLIEVFPEWMESLPHPEIVWIAGNHDFVCQRPGWQPSGRGHYLLDDGAEVAGLSFYGTPWVPKLRGWAFFATDEDLAERCAAIPQVDVLISHGPPLGYGDMLARGGRAGSEALTERLGEVPPQICVFGHIHEDPGEWQLGDTKLANVAHVDIRYEVRPGAAKVFELPTRTEAPP